MIANPNASVLNAYVVLAGSNPSATSYAGNVEFLNAYGEDAYVAALEESFADLSDAAMGVNVLKALGLAEIFTTAQAEAFYADNAGNRVKATLDFANVLSNYSGTNALIQAAKTTYNSKVEAAAEYASNPENTEDEAIVGGSGQTFTLTISAATEDQDFSARDAGGVITIDADDDATDGDEFEITGTDYNDTFILDTYLRADIDAGDGVDTLDLRDFSGTVGDENADVNLNTGVANDLLNGTFRNFENVIGHEDGGRIVGTAGANQITLTADTAAAIDTIDAAGGDDSIYADDDTFNLTDVLDGGSGTDTLYLDNADTITLTDDTDDIANIENIVITGTDDSDVTITSHHLFGSASTTSAITGGVKKITVADAGGDNTFASTAIAAEGINLIGVTFENIQTLDLDATAAGTGNIVVDSSSLNGVEEIQGNAADILVLTGGTYDFSSLEFTTLVTINGSASKNDTVLFGNEDDLGDITTVDLSGGTADTISFAGTDVGDIRALTTVNGTEALAFGSASSVVVDDAIVDNFQTITGSEFDSDVLTIDGAGGAATATLTSVQIRDVERVVIDDGGSGSTVTIGASTFAGGETIYGDSGTDTLELGASGVSLEDLTFVDVEVLDFGARTATVSTAVLSSFARIDGDDSGILTLTDSGALTLRAIAAGITGDMRLVGASGDDSWTITSFDDGAEAVDLRTGDGNDTVTIGASNTLTATTIRLGAGDDTIVISNTTAMTGLTEGGTGTDTVRITDAAVAAGELLAVDFTGFDKLEFGAASTGVISIALGANEASFSVIDLSADTNAAGANVVDLSAYASSGTTVIGSAGADTITTSTSSDTVEAGGGGDTIVVTGDNTAAVVRSYSLTLGGGSDTVDLGANIKSAAAGTSDWDKVTINDWTSSDKISVDGGAIDVDLADFTAQTITQGYITAGAPSTLAEAMADAEAAVPGGTAAAPVAGTLAYVTAFQFDGNTYVAMFDDVDGYVAADDIYVKLTGLHELTAANFVF